MESDFLRELGTFAEKYAAVKREEAILWDRLSRLFIDKSANAKKINISKETMENPPLKCPKILDEKLFVGILEAAKLMGISRSKIYIEINAGRLSVKKAGKRTLISTKEIHMWFEKLQSGLSW